MYYLIYISTSLKLMAPGEISDMLSKCRKKNRELNITGMLMYAEGTFLQVLEGMEKDVEHLYTTIQRDTRHKNLIEIISGEQKQRTFPDWSMAFLSPAPGRLAEFANYTNTPDAGISKNNKENTILNVLKSFADNHELADLG